ncbi:MAG: hypothetical protein GY754_45300 [bacterium]|nr:hypothetical protein [bacterium]
MKKFLLIIIILALGTALGCKAKPDEGLKKYLLENADSVIIAFYAHGKGKDAKVNASYFTVTFDSKEKIGEVAGFISDEESALFKCGYQGAITFLKDGKNVLSDTMEFNIHPGCRHIEFLFKGKACSRSLTEEGYNYLVEKYKEVPQELRI